MDRTAIVTGGTGGLGSAVVKTFLDDGWRVVVPWVAERELERVPEREGCELVQADLFDADAVANVVNTACGFEGAPLRAVLNLVGGFSAPGKVADTPIDDFENQFKLNLRPLYLIAAAGIPPMIEAGGGALIASPPAPPCARSPVPPATSPPRPPCSPSSGRSTRSTATTASAPTPSCRA